MKLYDHQMAPNTRRVRVFLAEKGIEVPTHVVDLKEREQQGNAFVEMNPFATVPVLELDDGSYLSESVAICRYFEALHPDPPLMGTDPEDIAKVEMWQRRVEMNAMQPAGDAFRNTSPAFEGRAVAGLPKYAQIAELAERGKARVTKFYEMLDKELANREFIAGDRYTIADITGLITVDFGGWSKIAPDPSLKNVHAWYERVNARPSAKA